MEILIGVIVFAAFSLLSDKIEGNKKKKQKQEQGTTGQKPRKAKPVERREAVTEAEIAVPLNTMIASTSAVPKKTAEEKIGDVPKLSQRNIKQEDLNADILLHAVAYAQILQPPKAYQYMATRSCRGDWMNNK